MTQDQNAAPALQITPEQLDAIKRSIISTSINYYHEFIKLINNLPSNSTMKQMAFNHLDTGILWFKEAVMALTPDQIPLQVVEIPKNDTPDAA